MARGNTLARQWKILQMLVYSRRGKTVSEISHSLNVHRRTVYRDLEALQKAGFPICIERRNNSTFWKMLACDQKSMTLQFSG